MKTVTLSSAASLVCYLRCACIKKLSQAASASWTDCDDGAMRSRDGVLDDHRSPGARRGRGGLPPHRHPRCSRRGVLLRNARHKIATPACLAVITAIFRLAPEAAGKTPLRLEALLLLASAPLCLLQHVPFLISGSRVRYLTVVFRSVCGGCGAVID